MPVRGTHHNKADAERRQVARDLAAFVFATPEELRAAGLVRKASAEQQVQMVIDDGTLARAGQHLIPAWAKAQARRQEATDRARGAVAPPSEIAVQESPKQKRSRDEAIAELSEQWSHYSDEQLAGMAEAIESVQTNRYEAGVSEWENETGEAESGEAEQYAAEQAQLAEQAELDAYVGYDPAQDEEQYGEDWLGESDDVSNENTEEE